MDRKTVRKLEQELEGAIAGVVNRMGLGNPALLPSQQAMQQMAKAAVAVYESEVESHRSDNGGATNDSG